MKNNFLITSLFILALQFYSFAQCPDQVNLSAGDKCFFLIWNTPPNPLPSQITYNSTTYFYQSGLGTSASPALYQENTTPNCGNVSTFTGQITINGQTCSYTGGILPLDLLDFEAVQRDKAIEILWTTTDEVNLDIYEVQRSSIDLNWKTISTINAKSESEKQKSNVNTYYYLDFNPFLGENYYRLKIKDKQGSYEFSKVVMINNDNINLKPSFYPNPVIDQLSFSNIDIKNLKSIEIFDNYGNMHLECVIVSDNIDVSKLPFGVYLLRIQLIDGTIFNDKIIKN